MFSSTLLAEHVTLRSISVEEEVLSSTTLLSTQEKAEKRGSITLENRLEHEVSFSMSRDIVGDSALSFRGLDYKATAYSEDGISLYRSVNGVVDVRRTTPATELYLNDGSGASSFGVSPMGGEVVLLRNRPTEGIESSLKTTLTTNDEYIYGYVGSREGIFYIQADADLYHRSDYALSNRYEPTSVQGDGKRINSDSVQKSVSLKVGVTPTEVTQLAAKLNFAKSAYGIPPNVYTDMSNPVWDAFSRMDEKEKISLYLYADYETEDLAVEVRGYYDTYEDRFRIYDDLSYTTAQPAVIYDDGRIGANIRAELRSESLVSSVVLLSERNEHNRDGGGMGTASYKADTLKASVVECWYIDDHWQLEGALSYTLLKAKEAAEQGASVSTDDKDAWDALLRLSYEDETKRLYSALAKKSRMPVMNEMFTFFPWTTPNPTLRAEESIQGSVGYEQMITQASTVDLSLYYYDIKDLIIYRNNGFINRETATHYGAEIRLENHYFHRQLWQLSYGYAHARDSEDEWITLLPEHQVTLDDTVQITRKWQGYLSYRYIGIRYSDNSATYTDEQKQLRGYHLVDLQLNYQPIRSVTVRVGIKNLLDEVYEWRYGFPAEGRSVYGTLEWKL